MHIVQMVSTHKYFKSVSLGRPLGIGKASGFQEHKHSKDRIEGDEPPIAKISRQLAVMSSPKTAL